VPGHSHKLGYWLRREPEGVYKGQQGPKKTRNYLQPCYISVIKYLSRYILEYKLLGLIGVYKKWGVGCQEKIKHPYLHLLFLQFNVAENVTPL
jgi:hypothetical protein